ncbi:MAG: hypothetical protein IT236_11100, partial [Bacteroidia bacterium]|nr:hypothetical protein [Bacteroidia bacterium]
MAIKSRTDIKIHFETGDIPTESQFWDLIDSYFHKEDDNLTLFEYNSNKRLGVGITTPGSRLGLLAEGTGKHFLSFHENIADLYGSWLLSMNQGNTPGFAISEGSHLSSINRFFIKPTDGNIGIGTQTPGEKLEVNGAIKIGNVISELAAVGTIRYNPANGDLEGRVIGSAGAEWKSLTTAGGSGGSSQWTSAASDIYYSSGKVGIGLSPSETLDVNGGLRLRNAGSPAAVAGTIKFDGTDILAYVGGSWKSLTGNGMAGSQWSGSTGSNIYVSTGNVGIGVTTSITERLEVAGAIKIGDSANADSAEGTIIYESGTFKGKTLGGWEVLVNSVDSVNGQTGDVSLTSNNITENTNLYFTEQRVRQTVLTGFTGTAGTISSSDNVLGAINKLSGNTNAKIGGSVPATSGLIPFSDGTLNSVQTNSNLTYLSNALGGYASIGTVLVGTFAANQSFVQGLYPKLTIYSKDSGSNIDLLNTGEIVLTGTISNAGQTYFGANSSPTAFIDIEAGTANTTSLRIRPGSAPINNLLDGSIWYDGTDIKARINGTTTQLNNTIIRVNGLTGDVVLSTTNISEGTNLYYTDTKVRAVTLGSFTSGAGTVASGDTYLQAIQKLNGNLAGLSTSTIPEGTNLYYTDTKVRAVTLGSFTSGAGTVASGDTYLQAIQKLNGNVVNVASNSQLGAGYAAAAGTVASTDTIKAAFQKLDGNIAAKISSQWSG